MIVKKTPEEIEKLAAEADVLSRWQRLLESKFSAGMTT